MQFILSEDEYKKLIHKDRIKQPIEEFIKGIQNMIPKEERTLAYMSPQIQIFRELVQTLSIKLDL